MKKNILMSIGSLLLLSFAYSPVLAYGTGTCQGYCGGPGSDSSCWCDNACTGMGDCCSDYIPMCTTVDYDFDTVPNDIDNCPYDFNPNQKDRDDDGMGDVCDPYPRLTQDCGVVREELRVDSIADMNECKEGLTWQEIREQCNDHRLRFHASVWVASNICPDSTIEELIDSGLTFTWNEEEYTAEEAVDIVENDVVPSTGGSGGTDSIQSSHISNSFENCVESHKARGLDIEECAAN